MARACPTLGDAELDPPRAAWRSSVALGLLALAAAVGLAEVAALAWLLWWFVL
jgi:hypothetical protein